MRRRQFIAARAVLNVSAGASRRATGLLGLGAIRSLFQLMGRSRLLVEARPGGGAYGRRPGNYPGRTEVRTNVDR
jgi:hypothetical protein